MQTTKNKVHVCTHSNNAVDEILRKLSNSGYFSEDKLVELALRYGSVNYKPPEELQQYELKFKHQ